MVGMIGIWNIKPLWHNKFYQAILQVDQTGSGSTRVSSDNSGRTNDVAKLVYVDLRHKLDMLQLSKLVSVFLRRKHRHSSTRINRRISSSASEREYDPIPAS